VSLSYFGWVTTCHVVRLELLDGGICLGPRSNNTPLTYIPQIYQELAQQKKEKEDRANVNAPKKRDFEAEQAESIKTVREKEAEAEQA
jgi:hypothetical protein